MKIVLIKDVKNVGRAHDVLTLSDGYALNYLIPQKLAVAATPGALKEATLRVAEKKEQGELDAALLTQNIAALADAHIVAKVKANEKGHLYDALNASDIVALVKSEARIDLLAETIKLEKPIKEIGTHTIALSHGEVFGSFPLTVEAE